MADSADPDWALLRAFLAVADAGSLSEAARRLGVSQPTLGRQVRALEATLGAELFRRHPRGLALTESGEALIGPARAMGAGARAFALAAAGREARLEGPVRITASEAVSFFHLGPILAELRRAEPAISIDLVPSDAPSNLLFREADIALRMFRPTQLDLIARHLGDLPLGFFAADSYLARRGTPTSARDLADHDLVGFDRSPLMIDGYRAGGVAVTRESFAVRVDHNLVNWAMVRAGCGIGLAQLVVGRAEPLVRELALDVPLPVLPLWLTAHEAMRHTPRVARVWAHLADALRPLCA